LFEQRQVFTVLGHSLTMEAHSAASIIPISIPVIFNAKNAKGAQRAQRKNGLCVLCVKLCVLGVKKS
jgi:flagellar assembly factor FliW